MVRDNVEIAKSMWNPVFARRVGYVVFGGIALLIPINSWAGSDETIGAIAFIVIVILLIFREYMKGIIGWLPFGLAVFIGLFYAYKMVRIQSIVDTSEADDPDEQILNHFNEIKDNIQARRSKVEGLQPWFTWMERLTFIFLGVVFLVIYAKIIFT